MKYSRFKCFLKQSIKTNKIIVCAAILILFTNQAFSQRKDDKKEEKKEKSKEWITSEVVNGLKFRCVGPAYASGRISDFAINQKNQSEWYVAVAAGNVWKTTNSGITWTPIFDNYGSWSIADVEIDPNNQNVIWVGTGEYNSQRAIGYGDGIYRSEDGGKSFKNMGLKNSEHIGRIVIDPRNSHVYVAAQGPLWGAGGDRGLYKSTDHGKTWNKILNISENSGITDIVIDSRNPDIVYCASYQRRRHVYTLINGGPESAIYKSTDAGATWTKLDSGLPSGDLGRIGLAISPLNPDYVYAIVEAAEDKGGFFRSINRGATWEKMSKYVSNSPQYYNRIYCDPIDINKVYSMDTYSQYTVDGGKNFTAMSTKARHVDDHAFWVDPNNTQHWLIGGDGGIYETFDHGMNWSHIGNLPVSQYYRVAVDNSLPFYYVYGGTQDNNSMGGPSRTIRENGIINEDWIVTVGGDGFFSRIDPENPNIVYSEWQHGGLIRFDRKNGEQLDIKPQPPIGEAYRWNWNSPLLISNFNSKRLYFAANKLFQSDDRGNSWKIISPDLTRQLDRNKLPVFGKIQSPEAVAKNASTSLYGNIVSLAESPLKEGLLYVGTDDGLIQVTEDNGKNWMKYEKFSDVPEFTYVSCLLASQHDVNIVYASFDGRKNNDLKPYLLKSTDKGKTWQSIKSNLPERGTVYCIIEDFINKNILFAGTEFGVFFSIDGGQKWIQLKSGLPTTAIYDMTIQKRESDLVLATFGRGIYILDDYSALKKISPEELQKESILFPIKDALIYIQSDARYGQGDNYYAAENPAFGATFTYYLKDALKTKKQIRQKAEKDAREKGQEIMYPSQEQLRTEDEEVAPVLLFTVFDESGNEVRRITTSATSGINRITWNLRYPSLNPARERGENEGMFVAPGTYKVSLSKIVDGIITELQKPVQFQVVPLNNATLPAQDRKQLAQFAKKVAELARVINGTERLANQISEKLKMIKIAIQNTLANTNLLMEKVKTIEYKINAITRTLSGDKSLSKRYENQSPSIVSRINNVLYGIISTTSEPTQTMHEQYKIASESIEPILAELKNIIETDITQLEKEMEVLSCPWTQGRIPVLKK